MTPLEVGEEIEVAAPVKEKEKEEEEEEHHGPPPKLKRAESIAIVSAAMKV